ncbi:hypothetical protein RRF57_002517 [Xylaria bambusicola]|uniref:60S ribosomal protein L34 n=1 Tax=Xylaria bambusicola TaxID=326684 RepID=A0AAN7UFE9_9PEZI
MVMATPGATFGQPRWPRFYIMPESIFSFKSRPTPAVEPAITLTPTVLVKRRNCNHVGQPRGVPSPESGQNTRLIRTPGGELRVLHIGKKASRVKCGDCGSPLSGIPSLRPRQYATLSKPQKTVSRAYGGSRCSNCVRDRVVRAFLIEEQKVVKKVLKERAR